MNAPTIAPVKPAQSELSNVIHLPANADVTPVAEQNPVVTIPRNHTISSIATDCGISRDQSKYAYKKATKQREAFGEIIDGARYFSDDEKAIIVAAGRFTDSTIPTAEDIAAQATEVEVLTPGSALSKYGGLALYEAGSLPTAPDSNEATIELYLNKAEQLKERDTRFQNLLSEGEIQACIQRGGERGALKAVLERSAEQKAYEQAMTGPKPQQSADSKVS